MVQLSSLRSADAAYDAFIQILKERRIWNASVVLEQVLNWDEAMDRTEKLTEIDRLKGWLDEFWPLPAAMMAELKQLFDVRFTFNSNAIEGNTLSQSETQLVLERGVTVGGKSLVEHLEVVGHKEAIDYVEELAQQEMPIGEWEIKQIHSLILRKIVPEEAGRYRQLDVKAVGTESVYPPHYAVPELMAEFVDWLGAETALHPVEFATEAHFRFVSIHPFRDGNGRAGRLFMNLLLLRSGFPIVVISNELRQAYIEALVAFRLRSMTLAQQGEQGLGALLDLVLAGARASLVEMLRMVVTAGESRGKGLAFYKEMLAWLSENLSTQLA